MAALIQSDLFRRRERLCDYLCGAIRTFLVCLSRLTRSGGPECDECTHSPTRRPMRSLSASLLRTGGLLCIWCFHSIAAYNGGTSWRNSGAFAALLSNGSVKTWGQSNWGGGGVPNGLVGVRTIYSTNCAFAALLGDGSVKAWGLRLYGGSGVPSGLSGVTAIYSTSSAFAALLGDGSVKAWGDPDHGGSGVPSGLVGVRAIYSTEGAFAALLGNGVVKTWGDEYYGGSTAYPNYIWFISNVQVIYSTERAFAALGRDGSVVVWGDPDYGGDSADGSGYTGAHDLVGVRAIYSTRAAFAALLGDGTVKAWGNSVYGGSGLPSLLSHVKAIYSTERAFAALTSYNDMVYVWGDSDYGGDQNHVYELQLFGVRAISSTSSAFAALMADGSVKAWGDEDDGGSVPSGLVGVRTIYSTSYAFAALLGDGSVKAWGDSYSGGGVPSGLVDVRAIYSTSTAFAALLSNGSVKAWGHPSWGGSGVPSGLENLTTIFGTTKHFSDSTAAHHYPCPHNTYGPGFPNCTACPSDLTQPLGLPGLRSDIGSCIECGNGNFSDDGITCTEECPAGYKKLPYNWFDGKERCLGCYKGYYADLNTNTWRSCRPGRYTGSYGQTSCSDCEAGTYSATRAMTCSPCNTGKTVSAGKGYSKFDCFKICPMGQYGSTESDACNPCKAGSFSNVSTGVSTCTLCEGGKAQSMGNQTACLSCDKGKWANIEGATECFDCPPGSSCGEIGMINPSKCPEGKYTDTNRRQNCTMCPPGRYQSSTGSAKCIECDAGTSNAMRGSVNITNCTDCAAGRYAPQKGSGACLKCGKDTFTALPGKHTNCTDCPFGKTTGGDEGAVECVDKAVACAPGEGPVTSSSGEMRCDGCSAGEYSPSGSECLTCGAGTYSAGVNSTSCSACPAGRYGEQEGQTSLQSACSPCLQGEYVSINGSTKCSACPPGSFCGNTSMREPLKCPIGRYSDTERRQSCKACPAGQFQNSTGSAKCYFCPAGKFLEDIGANSSSQCLPCSPGTYGDKSGLPVCTRCPTGQVQPEQGQESCKECTLEGKIKTNNAAHTTCIDNQALLSTPMVVVMFNKGVALSLAFSVAAVFLALAVALHHMKAKYDSSDLGIALAGLKMHQVVLKSALPGFSFGSEMVLIWGMMTEERGLGWAMLVFRLLHPITAIVLTYALYAPDRFYFLPAYLREMILKAPLHEDFMRMNVPPVGLLLLASACDVSVLQLMPWKESKFYTQSMGYPSMDLMLICMSVKMIQSLVSVVCQSAYLTRNRAHNDPTMSNQARALFGLSIGQSVVTLIMGGVILLLKWALLKKLSKEEDEKAKEVTKQRRSTLEMADLFKGKDEEAGVDGGIERVDNPLHSAAVSQLREDNAELRGEAARLKERLRQHGIPEDGDSVEEEISTTVTLAVPRQDALEADGPSARPATQEGASRLEGFGKISGNRNSLERATNNRAPHKSVEQSADNL